MAHGFPLDPTFFIDTRTKEGSLQLYKNENLLTSYAFSNNDVTLSERTESDTLDLSQMNINITALSEWIKLIQKQLKPLLPQLGPFSTEIEKDTSQLTGRFKSGSTLITNATYDNGTEMITLAPRIEATITFKDFTNWSQFLQKLYLLSISF